MEEPTMSTRCARCGGPIVEIVIENDSSNLTMRSCSTCDAREWNSGGERVELDRVLGELTEVGVKRRHRRSR
jgi:hypothetical protein